jgi:UDP-N-acetylmuramoyl-tripeptide--D-alanyl-D-alanine ligase
MAVLQIKDILEATKGELLSSNSKPLNRERILTQSFKGISIDSRTISDGEIFFALKGNRFNGHDFLKEALLRGNGAVVHLKPDQLPFEKTIIYVKDTLRALQDLAHFLRMRHNIPVIAITGSNGKTTTKEMTYAILSRRFKVLKNEGNLNNHIGLPLSLTRIRDEDEVVVLELGMNAPGEIRRLCEIAKPTHGIVTNIGYAHIGELGSLDAIRDAKLEILEGLETAILNADDLFLMEGYDSWRAKKGMDCRLITFSIKNDSLVKAEDIVMTDRGSSFTLTIKDGDRIPIKLNVHGLFNVYNALAASAVAITLKVSLEEIKAGLEGYKPFTMRFEVIKGDRIVLINDAYNANPTSMEEALKELIRIKDRRRTVAVLGDMLELGRFSQEAHRSLGRMISEMGIDIFIAVGEMMGIAAQEAQKRREGYRPAIHIFKNAEEASEGVSDIITEGDLVFIKGSRMMCMEKIIERIRV